MARIICATEEDSLRAEPSLTRVPTTDPLVTASDVSSNWTPLVLSARLWSVGGRRT
jgi:hypothetical protein